MKRFGPTRFRAPLSGIEAVLFDLDGTLIDTVALILASMRHATETVLGHTPPDEVLMRGVGVPLATQMRALSAEHADELVTVYRAHNWEVHDDLISEYPGSEEILEELAARGYPMAVVTSKSGVVARRGIERFGLERFFDVVVSADETERHKPEPEPLEHAAALLGVPARGCVYVGDSPYDMHAAHAAGAVAVAALWGVFSADVLLETEPDFAISSLVELPELLRGDAFRIGE